MAYIPKQTERAKKRRAFLAEISWLIFKNDLEKVTLHEAAHATCALALATCNFVDIEVGMIDDKFRNQASFTSEGTAIDNAAFNFAGAVAECLHAKPRARTATLYKAVQAKLLSQLYSQDVANIKKLITPDLYFTSFTLALQIVRHNWKEILSTQAALLAGFEGGKRYVTLHLTFDDFINARELAGKVTSPEQI